MDANRKEMCKSLLDWFNVLNADGNQTQQLNDLTNGVAIARAMHRLAPDFFTGKNKFKLVAK